MRLCAAAHVALHASECCYANKLVVLASGIHYSTSRPTDHSPSTRNWRAKMSKTAAIALTPSNTLFGRLLAVIDHALEASARISVRNGDLPYFGL